MSFMRPIMGYTLLELLVVMLVLSLLTGLVVPRLMTMYERVQIAYQRDEIFSQINGLGYKAFQSGQTFRLSIPSTSILADDPDELLIAEPAPLILPAGWQLSSESDVMYYPNGACSGGQVMLAYEDQLFALSLKAPFCRVAWSV